MAKSESNRYFTSDLHLGHSMAAEKRGFNSVKEHDEFIINTLKEICNKKSTLWILGDIAFKKESLELLNQVPANKKGLYGNHDMMNSTEYLKVLQSMHGFYKYKNMWLSHCPIHPQEMYRCSSNVHGHIHKNTNSLELPLPYINVNWDFWDRPVTFE